MSTIAKWAHEVHNSLAGSSSPYHLTPPSPIPSPRPLNGSSCSSASPSVHSIPHSRSYWSLLKASNRILASLSSDVPSRPKEHDLKVFFFSPLSYTHVILSLLAHPTAFLSGFNGWATQAGFSLCVRSAQCSRSWSHARRTTPWHIALRSKKLSRSLECQTSAASRDQASRGIVCQHCSGAALCGRFR